MESGNDWSRIQTSSKLESGQFPPKPVWDYAEDLAQLKTWLDKGTDGLEQGRARNLIEGCLRQKKISDWRDQMKQAEQESVVASRNPLEIDPIFKNVLQYVPVNTLLKCRCVDQTWNENSVLVMREKKAKCLDVNSGKFTGFARDFEDTTLFPFAKMGILLGSNYASLELYEKFFKQHGSSVQDLRIIESSVSHEHTLEHLQRLKLILKHVPNLSTLFLNLTSILMLNRNWKELWDFDFTLKMSLLQSLKLSLNGPNNIKDFLNGLLAMTPNVKFVNLEKQGVWDWDPLAEGMKKLNLQRITTSFHPVSLSRSLAQTQKLTEMCIEIAGNLHMLSGQEVVLKSQSDCLKILTLKNSYNYRDDNGPKLTLPVMKNLKHLIIDLENYAEVPMTLFNPLVSIDQVQVPNLETLCVSPKVFELDVFEHSIFNSVQELNLVGRRRVISLASLLARIQTLFPKLRKLTGLCTDLKLKSNEIQLLVGALSEIEELELEILYTGDDQRTVNLLSGIPMKSRTGPGGLNWLLKELAQVFGAAAVFPLIQTPKLSLFDCRGLKSLKLYFPESCKIDETFVYLGFLRLRPQLRLTLHGEFSLPTDLAARMTEHFQDVYFIPGHYDKKADGEAETIVYEDDDSSVADSEDLPDSDFEMVSSNSDDDEGDSDYD